MFSCVNVLQVVPLVVEMMATLTGLMLEILANPVFTGKDPDICGMFFDLVRMHLSLGCQILLATILHTMHLCTLSVS